ncbi:MAG: TrkA family potassium uptake protein [Oscillospiraceae bacterium]|jgi:trk system potassium uptake protein TrkA|nr:TrkA family potassium uptake protein [Oscillospiraceae bacterium]
MAKDKKETYGIIGLGRFGATLARALADAGQDVLVIDSSEQKIREARGYAAVAFVADSLSRDTLTQAGIQHCDVVVICIGEKIDTSILTTLTVKQLGVPRVIAKAVSEDQGNVLTALGAEVVFPESDMAERLAKRLTTVNVLDYLTVSRDIEITELRLTARIAGQTVAEAGLRTRYGLNIIALITPAETTTDIRPTRKLAAGDVIIVIGKQEGVRKFEQYLSEES